MLKKLKKLSPLVLLMLMVVFSTQAFATIVDTWEYTVDATFTGALFSNSPSDNFHTPFNAFPTSTLEWGENAGNGQSSLVIAPDEVSGEIDTYIGGGLPPEAYWAQDVSMIHNNWPIYAPTLLVTVMQSTVQLTDPDNIFGYNTTPGEEFYNLPLQVFDFHIAFFETPNDSEHPSDIFVLYDNFPDFNFSYGDQDYYVNLFPTEDSQLETLPDEAVDFINAAYGLGIEYDAMGFVTAEEAASVLGMSFTISTAPIVPEPSTFFLLGAGLLGLGLYRRRRKL